MFLGVKNDFLSPSVLSVELMLVNIKNVDKYMVLVWPLYVTDNRGLLALVTETFGSSISPPPQGMSKSTGSETEWRGFIDNTQRSQY